MNSMLNKDNKRDMIWLITSDITTNGIQIEQIQLQEDQSKIGVLGAN